MHHLYLTTDEGISWSYIGGFDSCATLSQFVRASENPGSNKVVFVNTSFITDTIANGQLDNNVWYMLSTDGGVTWGSRINITSYQPSDSIRAYCNVNAIFDNNDDLHIAWAGRKVTNNYYEASKIFHWDEVSDTITIVSSPPGPYPTPGGWWITVTGAGDPGAWRMPADQPQLIVDTNGDLYCLWHGNDDYNDYSAAGFFNGELYGAYSTDHGITWSDYVNLTNTHSPGAGDAETYMTAHPCVYNDSIWITYIEDKDAGDAGHAQGVETDNPVRCWIFPTSLITGIEEDQASISKFQEPSGFEHL
jgi:Neuraminidase (sialidase)